MKDFRPFGQFITHVARAGGSPISVLSENLWWPIGGAPRYYCAHRIVELPPNIERLTRSRIFRHAASFMKRQDKMGRIYFFTSPLKGFETAKERKLYLELNIPFDYEPIKHAVARLLGFAVLDDPSRLSEVPGVGHLTKDRRAPNSDLYYFYMWTKEREVKHDR